MDQDRDHQDAGGEPAYTDLADPYAEADDTGVDDDEDDEDEMERVFNMGVGMAAVVGQADTDRALRLLAARGVPAWVLGEVVPGSGGVRLTGRHSA
jgi:hypothetical protein